MASVAAADMYFSRLVCEIWDGAPGGVGGVGDGASGDTSVAKGSAVDSDTSGLAGILPVARRSILSACAFCSDGSTSDGSATVREKFEKMCGWFVTLMLASYLNGTFEGICDRCQPWQLNSHDTCRVITSGQYAPSTYVRSAGCTSQD